MPIGDSKAQKYVIEEFVRRTIGRSLVRETKFDTGTERGQITSGVQKLYDWWHQRKPYVRLVSNAVPHPEASKLTEEWTQSQIVFGGEPTEKTRFNHILYGGVGFFNPDLDSGVGLGHTFNDMYGGSVLNFNGPDVIEAEKGGTFGGTQTDTFMKPPPGITNVDVSYKGDKGALKKATISFKCYSLGDLERLEKLYMYPGMKLLLEWGWSKNTANPSGDFTHQPIPLVELDDETLKNVGEVHRLLSANRKNSGGCADGMMGTVTNFSWSINEDLSFTCTTNITDIGDSIFTSNVNSPKINKKTGDTEAEDDKGFTLAQALDDIENQIEAAGRKDPNEIGKATIKFTNTLDSMDVTFFRLARGTTSKLSSDSPKTTKRRRCYIKFGDVVDQLLNRLYMISSTDTQAETNSKKTTAHAMFSIGGALSEGKINVTTVVGENDDKEQAELPVTVISNHEYLVSTDPDVCLLPGQIGAAPYDVEGELGKKRFNTVAPSGLDADDTVKFAITADQAKSLCGWGEEADGPDGFDESKKTAGLLANIFVNTDMLQDIVASSNSVSDFLNSITMKINTACGNIWAFSWTMTDEHPGVMTCMDRNFYWDGKLTAIEMPVSHLSGIIKNLSIKSSINSNTANALFIASNSSKTGEQIEKSKLITKGLIPLDVDFSMDGISGVQFGTSFAIDYLPSRYRALTYLFAFNVNHSINPTNWDTTVTCKFRFATKANGYKKIYLSEIGKNELTSLNIKEESSGANFLDNVISKIEQDVSGAGVGSDIVTDNEEVQGIMPQSVFQSLDAQGVTIGAKSGDPGKGGIEASEVQEDVETRDELAERFAAELAKIYHKGTKDANESVSNAYAILTKIIYMPDK